MKKPAIILLCYARSGGTLFSKALASLPNAVLVSEVNPVLNAKGSIATQLKSWYNIPIHSASFAQMANEGFEKCQAKNKNFIIRDFSFIDFTPHKLNSFRPKNSFSTLDALGETMPIFPMAFVRNAFDVWISRGCPPKFSDYYLNYIKAIQAKNILIIKYEDFCENPEKTMESVCEKTGLIYDEKFISDMRTNKNVTGDVDLNRPSRGARKNVISLLKRKRLPQFLIKKAQADQNLAQANQLLGYPTEFYNADFEDEPSFIRLETKWFFKRIFLRYPTDLY